MTNNSGVSKCTFNATRFDHHDFDPNVNLEQCQFNNADWDGNDHTITADLSFLTVEPGVVIDATDISAATDIYLATTKRIFRDLTLGAQMSYMDNAVLNTGNINR